MKKILFLMLFACAVMSNHANSQTVPLRVYNNTPSTIWIMNVYASSFPACGTMIAGTFSTIAIPPAGFYDFMPWMGPGYDWASLSVLGYGGISNLAAMHPYVAPCLGPSTSGIPTMTDIWGPVPSGSPFQTVNIF